MQFVVYIAVLIVSISSILLELDWLTKPKLETKPAMHAASAPPPVPRAVAKADGPNAGPSPVIAPKKADAPSANETSTNVPNVPQAAASLAATPQPANVPPPVALAVNAAAAAVETTGKAVPAQPATQAIRASAAAEITALPPPQDAKQANAGNPASAAVELARVTAEPPANIGTPEPAAPEQPHALASNPPQAAPAQPPAAAPVAEMASVTTKRQCDVSACAAAYHSFREADCTYQPFEGARRVCVAPPSGQPRSADRGPRRETDPRLTRTAREIDRDIDWRATPRLRGPVVGDVDDDDYNAPRPPGRIIMIERGYGRWP